ncbi:hydrogenase maturation protease [Roseovarius pacificus]|uniref:hydrogenase maturation protease n=1 Tax=Roseovarius pacificus TaxID=337701 RepID=UPI002A187419|nr:hydrogenase maturation protease [Roseovarius pacificus]
MLKSLKTLLIGFGNTLRGDDGLGPVVAERFRAQLSERLGGAAANLRIIAAPQLMPEHAADLAQVDRAIFVDASFAADPGAIRHERIEPGEWVPSGSGHGYDPVALTAMAHTIYGAEPEVHLVSVGIAHVSDFCEHFSPEVAAAVPEVLDTIESLLKGGEAA